MVLRIGTRKSKLALIQTEIVRQKIEAAFPEAQVEIVEISTKGDEILDRSLTEFGGKGVFTQELEQALLEERIDFAVHSAKDLPMEFPEGLEIGAVLERADARDVVITRSEDAPDEMESENSVPLSGDTLAEMEPGKIVGTSSLRRELQIQEKNPLLQVSMLRGNVQTRLKKLREGKYDAIVLAAAGLERLGLTQEEDLHLEYLSTKDFLPAVGQGILAVEVKKGRFPEVLAALHDPRTALLLTAERSFLKAIGGSCNAPAAGLCTEEDGILRMDVLFAPDGGKIRRTEAVTRLTADAATESALAQAQELGERAVRQLTAGKVFLIGAGPGDMGLLTQRALACIRSADVLVYDNLVSASILNEAREDAELIYAGKRADKHHLPQWETNALLVKKAQEGKRVARVKGGDPFIFGRGGEEAQELRKAGVDFEIIPGVSSSYAAPAYAGIPVTHRDYASSFHVITGHESANKSEPSLNYEVLAQEEGTLVFLMGLKNLPQIAQQLIACGKDPKTPAAVVQQGTTAHQRCVTGELETIAQTAEDAGIQSPAITVVGGVANLAGELAWRDKGALSGAQVLLTGTRSMCEKQKEALLAAGAEPISLSLIQTELLHTPEIETAFRGLAAWPEPAYTWIVFTSSNGVELFLQEVKRHRVDFRRFAGVYFAVIGEGTKKSLEQAGFHADFEPSRYTSADLAREFVKEVNRYDKVLIMRAEEGSSEVADALEAAGIPHDDVAFYRTKRDERKVDELKRLLPETDYVTIASASAARAFAEMTQGEDLSAVKLIAIGPVTARAAEKAGLFIYASATTYTAEGIRDALLRDWK